LVILLTLLVWYKLPFKVERNYLASTLDGTTVQVNIHLQAYHNLFSPDKYEGKFIVNGHVYSTVETEEMDSFLEGLKKKIRGVKKYPFFITEKQIGGTINQELVTIMWDSNFFKELCFGLINKNDGVYYAPAANSSEAEELNKRVVKENTDK